MRETSSPHQSEYDGPQAAEVMVAAGSDLAVARFGAWGVRSRRTGEIARALVRSPATLLGLVIVGLIVLMAIFAPAIVPANSPDPYQMPRDWLLPDSPPGTPGHLLGTNGEGGDVLYGVVWGARMSLRLAVSVVGLILLIGVVFGSTAALLGGKWDEYLMRIVDVFQAVPELIFAIAIAGILGPSFRNIILALVITMWPNHARMIRGQILLIREMDFVSAGRMSGESRFSNFTRNILPNAFAPLIVLVTMDLGKVVLIGATLSFVGLSEAGLAEWGNLVASGQAGILAGYWWTAAFGGGMVFLWALSCNLVGDGLRDLLDPRTSRR